MRQHSWLRGAPRRSPLPHAGPCCRCPLQVQAAGTLEPMEMKTDRFEEASVSIRTASQKVTLLTAASSGTESFLSPSPLLKSSWALTGPGEMAQGIKMSAAMSDHACTPELAHRNPYGGWREPTPESFAVSSTCALWHLCAHIQNK